jgi:hypothetical protein
MMQAARLLLAILDTCKELRSLGTLEKFLIYLQELIEEQKQNIRTLDKTSVRIRKQMASDTYLNDPDFIVMRENEADLTNRFFEMQKAKFKTLCGTTSENSDFKLTCQLEDSNIRREIGNRFSLTVLRFNPYLSLTNHFFTIFLKNELAESVKKRLVIEEVAYAERAKILRRQLDDAETSSTSMVQSHEATITKLKDQRQALTLKHQAIAVELKVSSLTLISLAVQIL